MNWSRVAAALDDEPLPHIELAFAQRPRTAWEYAAVLSVIKRWVAENILVLQK